MIRVEYTARAVSDLKSLDKHTKFLIMAWIEKNLIGCCNPRAFGKEIDGRWKYYIGSYRLICSFQEDKVIILALNTGHRKKT